jgi:predicted permease
MTRAAMPARRIYRLFLLAYPVTDRRRAAREMEDLFEDLYIEARLERGRGAAWWLGLRAYVEAMARGLGARYQEGKAISASGEAGTASAAGGTGQADAGTAGPGTAAGRGAAGGNGRGEPPGSGRIVESIIQDARYALRTFIASPAVTVVAVVVFALGIGANTAVFSVVEATLLRSLPFADAGHLVDITERPASMFEAGDPGAGGGLVMISTYRAWRQRTRAFDAMAVYTGDSLLATGRGEPEGVRASYVESNLFGLLGVRPLHGRGLLPEDDRVGAPRIVVLSHGYWSTRFGGDPGAIGRTLDLDGEPYEIVGVMPRGFHFPTFWDPAEPAVWAPLGLLVEALEDPGNAQGACWVVGRLREGVTRADAKAELDAVLDELERSGDRHSRRAGWHANVTPLRAWVSEDVRQPLWLLLGAVGLVLMIACSNVANLLLARGAAREREMSIRMAVGASWRRLMGQVLVESLLLAAAGGLLGVLVAYWSIPLILSLGGELIPRINDIGINAGVLGATLAGTFLAGILAGLAPALRAARRAHAGSLVAAAGHAAGERRLGRATGSLVVVQVALTLMLLAGAGLLVRSLLGLLRVDLGFETDQILVAEVELPGWLYPEEEQRLAYAREVLARGAATPGVVDVALSNFAPFENGIISAVSRPDAPDLEGLPWATVSATTPEYFRLVGIPLLRGELYRDGMAEAGPVAIIDQAAVDAYFQGEDPIGRRLATYRWRDDPLTVIGVVGNVREDSLRDDPPPHVYVSLAASPGGWLRLLARTAGDSGPTAELLRATIREVDPFVPVEHVVPLHTVVAESLQQERFYASLLGGFALTAILMAGAGIFGVMRYAVARRTRELGIRVALGARHRDVLIMVIGRGLGLAAIGIAAGAVGAAAATRLLSGFLYDLSPLDPLTFVIAAIVLALLSMAASALPAWRATRVDPVRSLRAE